MSQCCVNKIIVTFGEVGSTIPIIIISNVIYMRMATDISRESIQDIAPWHTYAQPWLKNHSAAL